MITQPFVTFFYNLGKRWFQQFNSEQYIIFKAVLLVITIVLSLLVFSIISVIDEKKFYKLAEGDIEEVSISFILPDGANLKDNQIKHTQHYFRDMIFTLLVVMAIPIYLYFHISNGTEVALLIVSSVITFWLLVINRYVMQTSYIDYLINIKEKK